MGQLIEDPKYYYIFENIRVLLEIIDNELGVVGIEH